MPDRRAPISRVFRQTGRSCGEAPLIRSVDPHGLDGTWWAGDVEPAPCRHFCAVLGALGPNENPPRAGDFEVRPGPQVPFVVPRLLELDGVIAVISRMHMDNGYAVCPIAYFAERRPSPQDLTASWRKGFTYETQLGETSWRLSDELWDFELTPWISRKKLLWARGEGDEMKLEGGTDCP
jgi:hypothetical protein